MEKKESKIEKFSKKWGFILITLLLLIITFKGCSTNSNVSSLRKENSKLKASVDSLNNVVVNEKEVRDVMEEIMLDFLIYEDELDNKKITVSQIKDKIKSND